MTQPVLAVRETATGASGNTQLGNLKIFGFRQALAGIQVIVVGMPQDSASSPISEKLLNGVQAARVFGVSRWVIGGAKIASMGQKDRPFTGRFTTHSRLTKWFVDHPEFVASHYMRHKIVFPKPLDEGTDSVR